MLKGLLLDAAGTLLLPAEPIAETYAQFARAWGSRVSSAVIASRLGPAMRTHRALRAGDPTWMAYWHAVVRECTDVDERALTRTLYDHYASVAAWRVSEGAVACILSARRGGWRIAVVSNWDCRLRGLVESLDIDMDELVISAEEGIEKPHPDVFVRACSRLGLEPSTCLMVGDDLDNDVRGAQSAGCQGILVGGTDGMEWSQVVRRVSGL